MGHVPVIDSLRGLAASMVCFYHFVCTTRDYIYNEHIYDFFHFGYYGVHIFFVISGVVIPLSMLVGGYTYSGWFQFIKKRFIRIEPPYLVSIAVALTFLFLRDMIPGTTPMESTVGVKTILLHIGYLIPFFDGHDWINNVYWSLAVEFQYYLFLCLVFPIMTSKKLLVRVLAYSTFFLGVFIFNHRTSMLPLWLPMFMIGISYVLYRFKKIEVIEFSMLLALSLFFTYLNIDLTSALFGAGTLAVIHFAVNARNAFSRFFGRISYSLYLLHTIIGSAVINYLSHIYREPWQKPLVILSGFAVAVLGSYIMYRLVEGPTKRWASRIQF